MATVIKQLVCAVCQYAWYPRKATKPRQCPNPECRSWHWQKEK